MVNNVESTPCALGLAKLLILVIATMMSLPAFAGSYVTLKGDAVIERYAPDGDSIRFVAAEPARLALLGGSRRAELSARDGSVQLRLEGIDAPETHYDRGRSQPHGDESRDALLTLLGFSGVTRGGPKSQKIVSSEPRRVPVTVLTKATDPYGRPIAYLVLGHVDDLATASPGSDFVARSLNLAMIRTGMAYPMLYSTNPSPLRQIIRDAARTARAGRIGIWRIDSTARFDVLSMTAEKVAGALIFPKLYRRTVDHHKLKEAPGFAAWLAEAGSENDPFFIERGGKRVSPTLHLADVVRQSGNDVRVEGDPTEWVFIEN